MMKCAVGCVNKMAFPTEEGTALDSWCKQSGGASLIRCLSDSPFYCFDAFECLWARCSPDALGGNWDFSLSPLILIRGEIKERKRLINKKDMSLIHSAVGRKFFKWNATRYLIAWLHEGRTIHFKGNACMHFKCSISQLRPDGSESKRKARSISVMMCEKGKLLAQRVLFLITFHLAIFHLIQNKQLEMQGDDIQPAVATVEPAFPVNTHCRLRALVALAW